MFDALARPLSSLLAFFYQIIPDYAIGIVLLTVVVMVVLTPFTVKSTRSMLAMQRLQPELKRLQQQHKNDRQALNEAMMAFYKEHNVNPLGGCLPMVLQFPAFIGLYQAIRGLTHNPPKFLSHSSKLFRHLCPGLADGVCRGSKTFVVSIKSFGIDLAKTVSDNHGSFAKALPFYLLIALTTATQYYQQRQLNNRNPQAAAANPQMQTMQKVLPLVFLFIYVRIPAAVVLYFLVSNLLRIGQQGAMWRWDPKLAAEVRHEVREVEDKTKAIDAKSSTKPVEPKPADPRAKAGPTRSGKEKAKEQARDRAKERARDKDRAKAARAKDVQSKPGPSKPPPSKPAPSKPGPSKPAAAAPAPPKQSKSPAASPATAGNGAKTGGTAAGKAPVAPAAGNGAAPPAGGSETTTDGGTGDRPANPPGNRPGNPTGARAASRPPAAKAGRRGRSRRGR